MDSKERDIWMKEFNEFCHDSSLDTVVPPQIFLDVKNRLFPNPWKVFAKISVVHVIVGFFSLAICNQFGLNPFQTSYSLSDFFMRAAGHSFCMVGCGIFLLGTTYLLSNFFLNLEELESIRRFGWLQTGIVSLISIAMFYFLGAELVGAFVGLWLLGAFIGGLLSIEGSFRLRRQLSI